MQTALNENDAEVWPHIAPLLDDAMSRLSEADRHAIVLRYFDGKSLGEVGAALGASEDAAKKRVTRAVEKLRGWFTKRGVTLTATVLTAAISANSVQAAPVGLAATVTATVVKGAAISATTTTLVKGTMKMMAWTVFKTPLSVLASVLVSPIAAAVGAHFITKASVNHCSRTPQERAIRIRFGRKWGVATIVFSALMALPIPWWEMDAKADPLLFWSCRIGYFIVPTLIYVALVLFWHFQQKRELEEIQKKLDRT